VRHCEMGVILSGGSTLSGRSRRIPITTLNLGIGVLRFRASPEARSSTQDDAQEFRLDTMTHPQEFPRYGSSRELFDGLEGIADLGTINPTFVYMLASLS